MDFKTAVTRFRSINDQLKPLNKEKKTLTAFIKGSMQSDLEVVNGIPVELIEVRTTDYDPIDVLENFPRHLRKLFEAGVVKIDSKKFEEWAHDRGYDISEITGYKVTKRLKI